MNNLGIYCPNCVYTKNHSGRQVKMNRMMGSMSQEGFLLMRLQHGGTACITQGTIDLSCFCGYIVQIALGDSSHELSSPQYVIKN